MLSRTHSKGVEITFYKIQMALLTHTEPGNLCQCTNYKKEKGLEFEFREESKNSLLQGVQTRRGTPQALTELKQRLFLRE
jgi:hypothetical protein